jgi:hypothetical protein
MRTPVVTTRVSMQGGYNTTSLKSSNAQSWIGATYLREDQGTRDFELYGTDFLVPLGENGQLIGEYAHSSNNSLFLGNVSGSAYRLEALVNIIAKSDRSSVLSLGRRRLCE